MARLLGSLLGTCVALPLLAACGGGSGGGGGIAPPGGVGAGPDLTPTDVSFTPPTLTAGDAITVSDTVRNTGTQPAPSFQVGVYLSPDPIVTTTDVLLGFRTVGALGVSADSTGGGSMTVPITTAGGTYHVGVIVDDRSEVGEPNENDNVRVATTTLDVAPAMLPALATTALSFTPLVLDAGQDLTVSDTVENLGTLPAAGVTVGYYLSIDALVTTADTPIGFRTLSNLDIGEVSSVTSQITVPLHVVAGLYHLGAIVDDANVHPEVDELDNSLLAAGRVQVNAPPRPDLSSGGLSFGPASLDAGQLLSVSDVVVNQGVADAGSFRVGIYLSGDGTIDPTDRLLAVRTLAGLQAGVGSTVTSVPVLVPVDTPAGTWYVGMIVDDLGSVLETDETNNALTALGTLQVTQPPTADLELLNLSYTPTSVQPALGETVTVTDTVRNLGVVDAVPFRVAYFLSTNPVVTPGDLFLGERSISGLAVGNSSTASTTVTLPTGLGAGSYFLGAIADDQKLVLEVNRLNNEVTGSTPIDVVAAPMPMPQLMQESVQFTPAIVGTTGALQVQDTVRNVGTQSSGPFQVALYLSVDEIIDTDDVLLGSRTVNGLAIGFGAAKSAPYALPPGTMPGTYYVGAICDVGQTVMESDETDNALRAPGILTVN